MPSPLLQLFQHQTSGGVRERLCATLRLAINRHHLRAGQQLPSSRQLALDLHLSRVTVEAAYGQLESEGYLRRETGRGTFVAIIIPGTPSSLPTRHQPARFSARGQRWLSGSPFSSRVRIRFTGVTCVSSRHLATPEQQRTTFSGQHRNGIWRSLWLSAVTQCTC